MVNIIRYSAPLVGDRDIEDRHDYFTVKGDYNDMHDNELGSAPTVNLERNGPAL